MNEQFFCKHLEDPSRNGKSPFLFTKDETTGENITKKYKIKLSSKKGRSSGVKNEKNYSNLGELELKLKICLNFEGWIYILDSWIPMPLQSWS